MNNHDLLRPREKNSMACDNCVRWYGHSGQQKGEGDAWKGEDLKKPAAIGWRQKKRRNQCLIFLLFLVLFSLCGLSLQGKQGQENVWWIEKHQFQQHVLNNILPFLKNRSADCFMCLILLCLSSNASTRDRFTQEQFQRVIAGTKKSVTVRCSPPTITQHQDKTMVNVPWAEANCRGRTMQK